MHAQIHERRFDARAYRRALGNFATGVTVITARDPAGTYVGVTANSFNSVSIDPPLVLWSLDRSAFSFRSFMDAEFFVVNVLAADQIELSQQFATRGVLDKFQDLDFRQGQGGAPIIAGCAAHFECKRALTHDGGDHVILVGEVMNYAEYGRPGLLYHCGAYAVSRPLPKRGCNRQGDSAVTGLADEYLHFLVAHAWRRLDLQLACALGNDPAARACWPILCVLGDHGAGLSLAEISIMTLIPEPEAGEALTTAERQGWVSLFSADEGVDIHFLTEAGNRTLVSVLALAKALESQVLSDFFAEDVSRMKEMLKALIRVPTGT